ncbi:hypothetical protein B0H14DRAFT_3577930 [Mycena olivaceomarginata]|nr:hypothetical protein B0H14DRAFT_3577930 [Mycena olivaceomarginata]
MEHALAGIAITTFVKDLVELATPTFTYNTEWCQVGENKEQLSKLRDEVTGTLDGLTRLAQGFSLNTQPSLELLTALDDLKSHLESVHNKCNKASQHPSLFKSWWNRDKIDREIKRLQDLKKDCHDQFAEPLKSRALLLERKAPSFRSRTRPLKSRTLLLELREVPLGSHAQLLELKEAPLCLDTTSRIEHTANEVEVMGLQQKLERWLEYPPNMKRRQDDTQELQHKALELGSWAATSSRVGRRSQDGCGFEEILVPGRLNSDSVPLQPATTGAAVAYFYFDFRDEKSQHVKMMLQSIILQLSAQSPNSYSALEKINPVKYSRRRSNVSLVTLTPDITHEDIRRFIDSELLPLSHLTRRMGANEIVEKVVKKSNGMFRLAALLLMELRDAFNPDLHAILTSFPDNLFGVYSRFLQQIHPTAVFYVSAVLRWLAFSSSRVTMPELEDALAFNFSCTSEFVYDPETGQECRQGVQNARGMIVVEKKWVNGPRIVSLAHASVEDYLRSEKFTQEYTAYDLRTGPSHRFLAQTCLGYLLQFADRPLIRKTQTDNLLDHMQQNIGITTCITQRQSHTPIVLGSVSFAGWKQPDSQSWFQVTKPLNVCSELGYTEAVRFLLLQNGADPNVNENGVTALRVASYAHLDIVRILLQSGAQVNTAALNQASTQRRWDIVQALVQKSCFSVLREWIAAGLVIALEDGGLEAVQICSKHGSILEVPKFSLTTCGHCFRAGSIR